MKKLPFGQFVALLFIWNLLCPHSGFSDLGMCSGGYCSGSRCAQQDYSYCEDDTMISCYYGSSTCSDPDPKCTVMFSSYNCNNKDGAYCNGDVKEERDYFCSVKSCYYTVTSSLNCNSLDVHSSPGTPGKDYSCTGSPGSATCSYVTAVTLTSFTVTALQKEILIEWETDMEITNAGFNIWRSEEVDGEYTKINANLIPAQGSGSQYIFTDDTVTTGNTYYYKVEDIDLNGTSTFHGPAVSSVTSEADHQLDVKRNAVISNVIDFKNVYIIIGCPEKQRVFVEQISYGIRNGSLIVNSLTGIKENGEPIVHNSENPAPQIKSFDELIGTKLHIDCVGKDLMVLEYNVLTDNFGNVQYDMLLKDEYGTKTHFFISNEYINARTTTEEISLASMPSCTLNAYTTCAPNPSCVGVCGAIQSTNLCGCIGAGTCDWKQIVQCDNIDCQVPKSCQYVSGPPPSCQCKESTLIGLRDFTVTMYDSSVLIEWKTDTEVDNAGFNIWRSETEDGEYIKITDSLIPAQGSGYQYFFTDDTVTEGKRYYYKLEDIDLYGASTFHGPVSTKRTHKGLLPAIRFLLRN